MQQQPGQLVLEGLGVLVAREVAVLLAGPGVRLHDPVDQLPQARLAGVGAERAAEVFARDDGRRVGAPEVGELDAPLLEDGLPRLPVGLDDVPTLPAHLVVRMHAGRREDPFDLQPLARVRLLRAGRLRPAAHRLRHVPSLLRVATSYSTFARARFCPFVRLIQLFPGTATGSLSARNIAISVSKSAADSKAR